MKPTRRNFIKAGTLAVLGAPLLSFGMSAANSGELPCLRPPALKPGDTIAITSPAGAVWDKNQIQVFVSILERLGFKVKTGQTLLEHFGYFAGDDRLRAAELNAFFKDPEVKAVFCMKGGWGCARILDLLDYESIAKQPKIIMGFSDITALLVAIQVRTGLVTFHGPVGNSGWNEYTTSILKRVLMQGEKTEYLPGPKSEDAPKVIRAGISRGVLCGGNLSVLAGMIGSAYVPLWKNKILFLEETGEEPYRIDRMFTQLRLSGVLSQISGFVFGKCVKCTAEEPERAFTFQEVLEQHIIPLEIPAFAGAMIGHIENKITIPLGIHAELDAEKGSLRLLEPAVN
jgi:muramoyltetrapeptide carboxypeptidase